MLNESVTMRQKQLRSAASSPPSPSSRSLLEDLFVVVLWIGAIALLVVAMHVILSGHIPDIDVDGSAWV